MLEASRSLRSLDAVSQWPGGRAAVAVVDLGRGRDAAPTVLGIRGALVRPVPWASVTKPATALAVLVAVEEGTLALDEPAGPPGSTVRHLLAHASGLGPEPGPPGRPSRRDPRSTRTPATRCWATCVADRSGMPFADYLRRRACSSRSA